MIPGASLPLGFGASHIDIGGQVSLLGELKFQTLPLLSLLFDLGYSINPYGDGTLLSTATAGGGVQLNLGSSSLLSLHGAVTGGYALMLMTPTEQVLFGGGPYASGGIKAGMQFSRAFGIGVGAEYRYYVGLFGALRVSLGAIIGFNKSERARPGAGMQPTPLSEIVLDAKLIDIPEIRFSQVFPIFYAYYDDHPVGQAIIHNSLDEPAKEVVGSLNISRYMDAPKTSETINELASGETVEVDLYARYSLKRCWR